MAVGRISGPLLKANLLREGVNLAFETDLLYLDVVNGRIGVKTTSPTHELTVAGTTRTTNLETTTQANIASFTLSTNIIASSNGTISLEPSGSNPVVYQAKVLVNDNLQITTNEISTTVVDTDLEITTSGTGEVNVNSNMLVNGDLHATGNITADGDINIGSDSADNVYFNAEIASDVIPDQHNLYDLGTDVKAWGTAFVNSVQAESIITNALTVNGIDLAMPQGNIIYVATNGLDSNAGLHENNPVATITKALTLATAGDTVHVFPGVYEEPFPLNVPVGVTVHGASLRSVTMKPTSSTMYNDAFLMNGEATVEDFTLMGFHHDLVANTGHAFRFNNNAIVTSRSPYVRNVTVITAGTPSVLSIDSIKTEVKGTLTHIASIMGALVQGTTVTKTPSNPLDPDQSIDVSSISIAVWADILGEMAGTVNYIIDNGTLKANLPNISPNGSYVAGGERALAAQVLEANKEFLKAEAYAYATTQYSPTVFDETFTKRDTGIVVDAFIYDLPRGGNEHIVYAGLGFWVQPTNDPRGYARADAGHGAFVDGSVMNTSSREAAMLFHSVTFITPAAETLVATNGARIEWLNSFTYFADKGLYAYSSVDGFAGAGLTRLRINDRVGTWAVGNTVSYYDTDGSTLLASGTVASIDGNFVNLTGRQLGFETITDRVGKTVYAQGDAKLSTTQKKFGPSSLVLDGTGDYISVATQPDFDFGTNDFCLEAWVYPTSTGTYRTLFDLRTTAGDTGGIILGITDANQLYFFYNGNYRIGPVGTIPQNTWTHIALARSAGQTRAFINGTQTGSDYADTNNYAQRGARIGADPNGNYTFTGYIDDVRISKGVPRYTSTFTAPAAALTGDLNTVLLLHFNGTANSTIILDDGITLQDIRTSAGGTAGIINFADYSDFGAEIRSIGSANIYGKYGAYGDGPGVIAYLVSQNFAYIGAEELVTNDPNDRIELQEVVELNGARIYRTSVDNEGNFRVGDNFYVNQKTGEVLFNSQSLSVSSLTGVTFTDGTHTTIVTAEDITTGNIRISANTIESLTGDVNITSASGSINLQNNTYVTGNLDVTGDVTIGGNITIGDQPGDTVSFVAGISSDLIPATTATYDLGTDLLRWRTAYFNRVEVDSLVIDSNTISTTANNDDLQLVANGTGRVYIPSSDVQIDQSLTVTQDLTVTTGTTYLKNTEVTGTITQTGDINQTGDFTTSGNTSVTGNITGTGYVQLPQVRIENNVISTTVTDANLELRANGTGNVVIEGIQVSDNNIQSTVTNSNITLVPQGTGGVIVNSTQSVQIPVGTTLERPDTPTNGMIRYNTDLLRYEGWNNGYWVKLSGVQDVDGSTRILAEATPGANDNTIYFYADDNLTATIDNTKLFAQRFQTSNIDVNGSTISTITTDTDLNLSTTGTGAVKVGNFRIYNNTITNISTGAVTEFVQTGTGYVKIAGTNGVVIPAGDSLNDRPSAPEVGMMRFNTYEQLVEVFNGVSWSSVAGNSGGVTSLEATDIGITAALILG